MNNFWQRAITGAAFVTIIILSILFGPMSFQLLFLLVSLLSLWEFYTLVADESATPQKIPGVILGGLLYLSITLTGQTIMSWPMQIAIIYGIIILIFFMELYRKKTFPFHSIAYTLTGVIYIVLPFALLVRIAYLNENYNYLLPLGVFLLIWTNDTFAYLTGMKFGKHRLFERISPKKSWEGSAGGLIFTIALSYILYRCFGILSLNEWMVTGIIITVAGTLGDLVESMLKRSLKLKDSGTLLPGHGGLLDRFDALLLAVPLIYIYLVLL